MGAQVAEEPIVGELWKQYHRDGDELRHAPARVRPTEIWTEARRRMYGDHFPVFPVPPETELTRFAADQLWEGDRFMDPVAAWFAETGPRARATFERALEHGIENVLEPPQVLIELFEHLDRIPDWMDWDTFEKGRQLAADTSLPSSTAQVILDLVISVLGEEVSWAAGSTGRVIRDPKRRALETHDWLYQITRPNAFDRYGKGFKDTVRVRLMHSLVRHGLMKKWDPEFLAQHGNPISSAHMAFGASSFGLSMLLFDMKAGRRYSQDDLDAVALYWGYVVYIFGAHEDVVPKNAIDNMRFGDYMMMTMGEPTEWTQPIVEAALFGGALAPYLHSENPRTRFLMRRLIFPLAIGYAQYLLGPGIVHEVLRYSDLDRDYSRWEVVGRVVAFAAVVPKRLLDLLPHSDDRRAERTRDGDPMYGPLLQSLYKEAEELGVEHSGYTHHDRSASGASFATRAR